MGEQEVVERRGREGGRWINERPAPTEFAEWFTTSMKIDAKLKVEDYIGGVVLIPALDKKAKTIVAFRDGQPVIDEREELSFVPYAKVETRIHYFWDLLAAHPEWLGIVEPVELPRLPVDPTEETIDATVEAEGRREITSTRRPRPASALAQMVHQLPPGFSMMSVPVTDAYSHFLCCTMRVAIYDRAEYKELGEKAVPLRTGRGTKMVPLLGSFNTRVWAESSSVMKAETGALGRALGFAGIFVIPGSGVATAEDMIEAMTQGDAPTSAATDPGSENQGPAAPEPPRTGAEKTQDDEATLRKRAKVLYEALAKDHKEKAEEFGRWATSRRFRSFDDAKGAALVGTVKQLEKLTDQTKQPTEEKGDVPSAPAAESG